MPNNPVTVTANYVPVGTNLQVKVSSQTTGAAVIGATVTMTGVPSGAQPYLMGTTDSSGEYTFQNVLAGGYVVSVSAQGYQTNTGSGTAPMGGTGVITVTLAQSPTYTVIFEESGLPNTEPYLVWSVTLNGQTEPSLNYPGNTNAEITFSNLQSDTYQFTIEPPQGYSASSPSGPVTVGSSTCTMTVGGSPPACVETITFTPSGQTTVNGEAPSQTTISLGNSVDDVPVALTYDSSTGEVFVGTFSGGVFVISDTTNAIVATVATASVAGSAQSVSGIAYDSGNNEVFVTNPTSQTVSAISVDTNTVVATISVNGSPTGVTYDSGKGEVFVTVATSHGDGSAYVISDVTNSAIAQIPVGPDPVSAAYDSAKGEVFIANKASNTVSVVSDATNAVTETINVEGIPTAAVYDSGQSEIFVSNYQSGTLSVISDTTDTVVATVNVRAGPLGLAYDPSTGQIIVSNPYDSNLSLVSDSSLKVANILVSAGFSSNTMVYDSGQRELFVGAAGSEIVSVIPMSPA
jgi:YVTN family beta-propeller protein